VSVFNLDGSVVHKDAIDSGIDRQTMNVERQLPRKSRIINAVSPAAIVASRTTSEIDSLTKMD